MSWQTISTAERIAAIREVYPHTVGSMRAIAAELSLKFGEQVSRNSVAGIYERNRDELRACKLTGAQPGGPQPRKERPAKVAKPVVVKPVPAPRHAGPALIGSVLRPDPLLKTLVDLNHNECRWPIDGERAETRFCCHAVSESSSYCEYHRLVSAGPNTRGKMIATRRAA